MKAGNPAAAVPIGRSLSINTRVLWSLCASAPAARPRVESPAHTAGMHIVPLDASGPLHAMRLLATLSWLSLEIGFE